MPSLRPRFLAALGAVLVLVAVLPALRAQAVADIPPRPQAPNDESELRHLVLENGLKVVLLSDPRLNKSSASLDVGVGSLSDPPERQGLAHFLEHMLFLGTEKYPSESEYGNFVRSNAGYANAFTAGDHTNFHFEIRHEAFAGALDRFSQFFIAPLFTPEFTEREMNAVNSENQKNLENDSWREYQLRSSLYRDGHAANHFATGSLETLAGTTQEVLRNFYEAHYSANLMTLALVGRASLDQLEAWAREYFSAIPNRQLEAPRFPPDFLRPLPALRLARMKPVRDLRELSLEFPLPPSAPYWRSKPAELLGFILGYEGEGSLLSALKAEGLATALGAGGNDDTRDYGSFNVSIALTPEGEEHFERVLALFFSAVADLRRAPYPEYLFQERRKMAELDELYRDKGEGADRAVDLANQLRVYPLEVVGREPYLWLDPDPAPYQRMLGQLRPDNMLAVLIAREVPTDRTEQYYGTEYSYTEQAGPSYAALLQPPAVAAIHLPAPNPFVPGDTGVLPEIPLHLIDEPALSLYYAQDVAFERPMVAHVYRFRLPRSLATLPNAVLLRFYQACVTEALNEVSYTAGVAGLQFSLAASLEGVTLTLHGYDDAAPRLLDAIAPQLIGFHLSAERFAAIKDRIVRELASFDRMDAWQYILETRRSVVREFYFRPDQELPEAEKVTLAQVREFAQRLFAHGRIEGLTYGNVTSVDAVAAARRLAATWHTAGVPAGELLRRRLLGMTPGETLTFVDQLAVNNSAFRREYTLGGDAPEIRAATLALASFIEEPFYSEMRTRQQLGYIVFGGAGNEERTNFAYFIIQSGDYPADELARRADTRIQELPELLGQLSGEDWETIVGGVAALLQEKDKTIADRAVRLFTLAYDYDADWDRREDTLSALEHLTRERAREILAKALAPETREMRTFLGFARDHHAAGESGAVIEDRAAFKEKREYR